ncbi:hypothetical protein OG871_39985 (plasmid) [Kitasatospora sp. NBC_00374]|uniref:hypothetical protein n=1 Tax=Kitasatospora sp. NBC_00374 TaxID=2975964 RepID=UPI002F915C33
MTVHHPHGPQGQHPAVWVTQAYPAVLQSALNRHGGIPAAVRELVLQELHHRTPGELRERIERRFYARFSNLSGTGIAERADDIAYDLAAPPECRDPRCEDGWHLDADHGCPLCRQRRIDIQLVPAVRPPATPEHQEEMAHLVRQQIRTARSTARHVHPSRRSTGADGG